MQYDPHVTLKVIEIIKDSDYDFILAYHQEYDLHPSREPKKKERIELSHLFGAVRSRNS